MCSVTRCFWKDLIKKPLLIEKTHVVSDNEWQVLCVVSICEDSSPQMSNRGSVVGKTIDLVHV